MIRLAELKSPFKIVELGDCVEVLDRLRKPINADARRGREGNVPYYGANGPVGFIDEWIFNEELVLVAEDGGFFYDPFKPISYRISGKAWVNNHAHVLRATARVDVDWLNYTIAYQDVTSLVKGATLKKLNQQDLKKIRIPLPDIGEQRRIVARIKECMERVEEIDTNSAMVARELDALFPALLNERFAAINDATGTQLLEDVADIRGGTSLPKGAEIDEGTASALLVKVGDMNAEGNERTIEVAREFLPLANAGRGVIEPGAVIFPKRGGAIATNKKRLLGRPALLDPNLMAVVAKREVLRPDYLYYWCLALDLSKLSNGGVIPQLNRKDLAPLELPVPKVSVQDKIVEDLQQAELHCLQLKLEFESAQADRARLREAILRKAFAGAL